MTENRSWQKSYPRGVPAEIDPDRYASVVEAFHSSSKRFADRPCFENMGVTLTFAELEELTGHFAAFLVRDLKLEKGDRIGIQLPNVLQYPVALFGALRAGLVVVNTNPLYTTREMEHQYRDAGVKAIVILANFADKLAEIVTQLGRPHVIVTELGDLFPLPKRLIVNAVVKHVKKMVPQYHLPTAIGFRDALRRGQAGGRFQDVAVSAQDLAFLQYTGGTTGEAKGAMLTHRNVVANMEQAAAWMSPRFVEGGETVITPLPLYHVFSLTVNCLVFMKYGGLNVLVTNPRDFPAFIKLLQTHEFTVVTAVNTLLNALMNQPGFAQIDFSRTKLTVAGAMALQKPVAERWRQMTKSVVIEGYGLTEASPVVACNPVDGTDRVGTIGLPFPSTDVRLVNDDGTDAAPGQSGELVVRGPQVMKGYWKRQDETDLVLRDGWLFTGDVAEMDADGFLKIVDRKKDMILVSGFNVYPNEVEAAVAEHPDVAEVGAIGIADEHSGEIVKIVVVRRNNQVTERELIDFCRTRLAGYKIPKLVEFRSEMPKTSVGKILRRALK